MKRNQKQDSVGFQESLTVTINQCRGGTSTLWVYFFIYSIGNNLVDFKSICGEWMGGGADLCTHRSKKTEEQIVAKEVEKIVMQ
jgi:hypothetical protein